MWPIISGTFHFPRASQVRRDCWSTVMDGGVEGGTAAVGDLQVLPFMEGVAASPHLRAQAHLGQRGRDERENL
jgi:hypothetical protein